MIAGLLAALALAAAQEAPPAAPEQPSLLKALEAAGLDPKTKVDGQAVQVMYGQRAVLRFDGKQPVLDQVEIGRIDRATAPNDPKVYKGVRPNRLAFALDASSQKRVSMLKVWNGLTQPVAFEAEIVALRGGQLMKKKAPVCAVAAGGAAYETWPDPIIAITLTGLGDPPADTPACNDEKD